MTDSNYALRELLIACADWYACGAADNPASMLDARKRYERAVLTLYNAGTPPNPSYVLHSLGWKTDTDIEAAVREVFHVKHPASPPGSGIDGLMSDVQGAGGES